MKSSNVAWNAAGLAAPLAVALVCVPALLQRLGAERFGLLALAWALTAVSGLFDLGIGRATTRSIAAQLGRGDGQRAGSTLAAATRIAAWAGLAGAMLLALAAAAGAHRLIHYNAALETEVLQATLLLALVIPLQTMIATYRGASEACQQFRGISLVRMALGVANFAAPLAVALYSSHLALLVLALLLARVAALAAYRQLAHQALPGTGSAPPLSVQDRRVLLRTGGWFSVSAVVSPLLVQADRFVIGAVLSAAAVSTYAIPFDLITQLLIVVTAVSTVAFPSITHRLQTDAAAARVQFDRWLKIIACAMAIVTALVAWWLPALLNAWIGGALPAEAASVGRWLCLGVWINAIGSMYFAWLHAQGRIRATALLHLVELPLYLVVLVVLLHQVGVTGAALAWVLRVGLDSVILAWLARRQPGIESG
jgi:O-antigen/teichoic acid export membrane protein